MLFFSISRSSAQYTRYSSVVRSVYRGGFCGKKPISFLACSGFARRSTPLMYTLPSVWLRAPQMMFIVVDLPAPLEPNRPVMPCWPISRLISRIAQELLYLCDSRSIFKMLFIVVCINHLIIYD